MKSNISTSYILTSNDLFDKINTICTAAHHMSNIDEILMLSLRNTLELFKATRGSIFLLDKNGLDLELRASIGMKLAEQKKLVKKMGEGIVGKVAEEKKPIIVNDIRNDNRFKNLEFINTYKTHSFICSPLMIKDKLIGVINIAEKENSENFKNEDLEMLDFISNQIAVNYQHAHLNLNLKTTLEETQNLKKEVILQERLATLGKLAGGIAHEFNNPLDGVMRYNNLALEHLDEDDTVVREYLLEVKQGLKRMANIVKSLLACARNEHPSSTKVDINKAIEIALKEQNTNLIRKKIFVEKELHKNIPEIIDLGLDRILSNLISNAIDATDNNGKIFIKSITERGYLKLIISDTGKGIPKDLLKNIFDPFFTTKKIDQGCGLGLTIVHEIIKHYSGQIAVESAPNEGTTFTILLPLESQKNEL